VKSIFEDHYHQLLSHLYFDIKLEALN